MVMVAVFMFYIVRHESIVVNCFNASPILFNLIMWKRSGFRISTIELPPSGWQDASTEYFGGYFKSHIKNNGTVAAWGYDGSGKQKAFIAMPATKQKNSSLP
jgi:hypothetical protein